VEFRISLHKETINSRRRKIGTDLEEERSSFKMATELIDQFKVIGESFFCNSLG
jgi:hypothetical protein